ncbi:MAG: hypothetical protein HXY28_01510 [Hydrogenophilaceae bacterium]|jgi:hypothetical protein|nr:hypothetical protein [Hydrogenophilaceae bacterium]
MSLNKTLDRLFDEIRREAKRNPAFADRLDAVLRAHASRREVDEAAVAEVEARAPEPAPPPSKPSSKPKPAPAPPAKVAAPAINPVGILQKGGEDALEEALISQNRDALLALVEEHNLDPSGEAERLDREALQAHVVAQAKKRVERDKKLFDY